MRVSMQAGHQEIPGRQDQAGSDAKPFRADAVEQQPGKDAGDHHGHRERGQDQAGSRRVESADVLEVERDQVIDPDKKVERGTGD